MSLSPYPLVLPTIDENLILSDAIEFNMKNNPNQPFYTFSDPEHGLQVITHLEFGRATHRIAHALRPLPRGRDGEVIAIIAHIDTILYQTIIAGMIVAGFVPLPILFHCTPASVVADSLMNIACHRVLVTTTTLKSFIDGVKTRLAEFSYEVEISEIPSIGVAYPRLGHEDASDPFEPYPLPRRPSVTDTCIINHTSGSTGVPKPIKQTHLFWSQALLSWESQQDSPRRLCGCMAIPPSTTFGVGLQLFQAAYRMITISLFPPASPATGGSPVPPTPQNIIEHAKATKVNALYISPIFIEAWSRSPEIIEYLKGLDFITYTGFRLLPRIGNQLAVAGVKVKMMYASTEFGVPINHLPQEGPDWEYVRFTDYASVRWNPQGNGVYECQFLTCKTHKPMVENLVDVEGFAPGDIFKPHPTKEGLWKNVGRLNEIIVHSSGEKTVPAPIEDIIAGDLRISGVLVFSAGRAETGVLIELKPQAQIDDNDKDAVSRLHDEIWPTIEEANKDSPDYSKISKELIIFTAKERPLLRAMAKPTVLRSESLQLYASEISALYEN